MEGRSRFSSFYKLVNASDGTSRTWGLVVGLEAFIWGGGHTFMKGVKSGDPPFFKERKMTPP